MSWFDHTERGDDKPDWMIMWFPQILLAACLLPLVAFAVAALVLS